MLIGLLQIDTFLEQAVWQLCYEMRHRAFRHRDPRLRAITKFYYLRRVTKSFAVTVAHPRLVTEIVL